MEYVAYVSNQEDHCQGTQNHGTVCGNHGAEETENADGLEAEDELHAFHAYCIELLEGLDDSAVHLFTDQYD